MEEFWNDRYRSEVFAYGTEPNEFLKSQLADMKQGRILFPAEGEGRNAVYAAKLGWDVSAFDISEQGKIKAEKLAAENKVAIHYTVSSVQDSSYKKESFDAIALVFAHFPGEIRQTCHRQIAGYLKPGGLLILEGFTKKHLEYSNSNPLAGGPKNETMLFSIDEIKKDFEGFEFQLLTETETELKEGQFHVGKAHVLRCLACKRS